MARNQFTKTLFTIRRNIEIIIPVAFAAYFVFGTFFQHGFARAIPTIIVIFGGIVFVATALIFRKFSTTNTFFTAVPEGAIKEIVKGEGGPVSHFVMAFKGYHLNDPRRSWHDASQPDWEVLPNAPGRTDRNYDDRLWLTHWIGIYSVGIPKFRDVFSYKFMWNEQRSLPDGSQGMWSRDEETQLVLAKKFAYLFCLPSVITKDGLEVKLEYLVTLHITNPNVALNDTDKWLMQIQAAAESIARGFVNNNEFMTIRCQHGRSETTGLANEGFAKPIIALTQALMNEKNPSKPLGTKGAYGVTIDNVDLLELELTGDAKKNESEAVQAVFVAQQKGDALRITGDAEAYALTAKETAQAKAIEMNGAARASAIRAELDALKDAGELAPLVIQSNALIEASKGAGTTLVWANSPFAAAALPAAANLLEHLKPKEKA
jgi:regulator of protease activity HflC (stomatin/prohibitin superfamily)